MRDIYNKTNNKIRSSINASEYRIMYSFMGTLLLVTILSFIILSSSTANGEVASFTSTSNASVTVASTCSMTATVDTDHSAIIANGTYRAGIGQTTIKTFCNDPDGYAIYAIGYTGGDAGVTAGTNTRLHSTALGDDYDINTGTTESGDTSSWAMKLTSVTSTSSSSQPYAPSILNSYDAYHAVPANYAKVASFSSMTDNKGGIGSSLTTTYAAYVSGTQPAGTYTGQVKYILVHPSSHLNPDTYYMQEVNMWGSSIAVGQEVTAYDTRDNKSYTVARLCMEGYNASTGACESSMLWMTQNLDLDLSTSTPLNSVNTDLNTYGSSIYTTSTGYSKDANGTIYWTPANSTVNALSNWTHSSTAPASLDPGDWYATNNYYNSENCFANSDNQACNYITKPSNTYKKYFATEATASDDPDFGTINSHRHVGNYYNWNASVATNNSSAITTKYDNAANSICPKGWRLPKITGSDASNNEFIQLNRSYNPNYGSGDNRDAGLFNAPFYAVRSGHIGGSDSKLYYAGYNGGYWSNVSDDNSAWSFILLYSSGGVDTAYGDYRFNGFSLRCVAREEKAIDEVNTMQEFATMSAERKSEVVASMATDHQYLLTDERDSKAYYVAKLKDGNIWMLDNLATDLVSLDLSTLKGSTNASDITLEYLKGVRTGTSSDKYAISAVSNQTSFVLDSPHIDISHKDITPNNSTYGNGSHKTGGFYNFCATSAGSFCYTDSPVGNATEDICPAGWRLPTGGPNEEFETLSSNYSTVVSFRTALSLPLSGHLSYGELIGSGETGNWWSSMGSDAYNLYVDASSANASSASWRPAFYTIRCLLR